LIYLFSSVNTDLSFYSHLFSQGVLTQSCPWKRKPVNFSQNQTTWHFQINDLIKQTYNAKTVMTGNWVISLVVCIVFAFLLAGHFRAS